MEVRARTTAALVVVAAAAAACAGPRAARTGGARTGSILVAGERVPVALRVVGPRDPGGFDASSERCAFAGDRVLPSSPAAGCAEPRRYGLRSAAGLSPEAASRVAARGFDRGALEERVDQVVLHYDAAGTSRRCFEVLHDERGLSCHFLLDADGTVRQTLDLALRARHATTSNDRSVGVEIAHVGAYPQESSFGAFYRRGADGALVLSIPQRFHPPAGGPFRPARDGFLRGSVNGRDLVQPDFTDAQYESLAALLRELVRILPRVAPRVPRDAGGGVPADALPAAELAAFRGVLGHQHVQRDKTDPGPAFDWERIDAALRGR